MSGKYPFKKHKKHKTTKTCTKKRRDSENQPKSNPKSIPRNFQIHKTPQNQLHALSQKHFHHILRHKSIIPSQVKQQTTPKPQPTDQLRSPFPRFAGSPLPQGPVSSASAVATRSVRSGAALFRPQQPCWQPPGNFIFQPPFFRGYDSFFGGSGLSNRPRLVDL